MTEDNEMSKVRQNPIVPIFAFVVSMSMNFGLFTCILTLALSIIAGQFESALSNQYARYVIAGLMLYPGLKIAAQVASNYLYKSEAP
jgi:hypothetical protein